MVMRVRSVGESYKGKTGREGGVEKEEGRRETRVFCS